MDSVVVVFLVKSSGEWLSSENQGGRTFERELAYCIALLASIAPCSHTSRIVFLFSNNSQSDCSNEIQRRIMWGLNDLWVSPHLSFERYGRWADFNDLLFPAAPVVFPSSILFFLFPL